MHPLDSSINSYLDTVRTVPLTELMLAVTGVFDPMPFILIALCVTFLVYHIRGISYAFLFGISIALGTFLIWFLKIVLNVARPTFGIIESLGKSFPSGHATMATLFFTLLIFIFDDYLTRTSRKIFNFLCVTFIFFVAVSRVYLGVHWVSDVVGGILLGALCAYFATEIFRAVTKV